MGEAPVRQRAHQPEDDLERGEGAGREVEDERGQGARHGGHGDAGEDQGQGAAAPPGEDLQEADADHRASDAAERKRQREGGRDPGVEGQHRPQGRGGRDSDQPRLGQRIAQEPLQRRAREAQRRAHHDAEDRARQAHLEDDDPARIGPRARERGPNLAHADLRRPDAEGDGEDGDK
jgi:hypothetical protein